MKNVGWFFVEMLTHLLEHDEREAVLGDLIEANESAWGGFTGVLGLVIRRQLLLWKSWRPWLAAFGLALPGSLFLMGLSVSISLAYQRLFAPTVLQATGVAIGPGFTLFLCNVLLLIGWSWAGGFVLGTLSRRTLQISAICSFLPCLLCLSEFRIESLSRFCLLIFLLPAIWGVRRGLHLVKMKLSSALILAIAITLLTIPTWKSGGAWIPNWALSWPAWYLVITSRKSAANKAENYGKQINPVG